MFNSVEKLVFPEDMENIKNTFLGKSFPWYLENDLKDNLGNPFFKFSHHLYINSFIKKNINDVFFTESQTSPFLPVIFPILNQLNILSLLSVKANLLTKTEKIVEYKTLNDFYDKKVTTALFYVNNNNGYTIFNNNKIYSKENSMYIFPSNISYVNSSCSDKNVRIIIDMSYISGEKNE